MPPKVDASPGKITAIVCTFNRYDRLADALLSLEGQSMASQDYEVIVVDNSSDKPAQTNFWRRNRDRYRVRLEISDRAGLSRARNAGSRLACAPLVAYLDDDAIASATWLEALTRAFEQNPDAGVVGGPVKPVWPGEPPRWLHPWLEGFYTIVDKGGADRLVSDKEWLAGANIAYRRDALLRVGGFDEGLGRIKSLLLSNEELETTRRIRALGLDVHYAAQALVRHQIDEGRTHQSWLRRRVAWQAVSDALSVEASADLDRTALWDRMADYLLRMPVEFRNVRGLFLDVDNPEDFNRQCLAMGSLMQLMLFDGSDPESPASK